MSYDIYHGDNDFNITYNLSPMFYAFSEGGIRELDGLKGKKAFNYLHSFQSFLYEYYEEMEKLNPTNGWGTLDGLLSVLSRMLHSWSKDKDTAWKIE